jgi:hypothetical protein
MLFALAWDSGVGVTGFVDFAAGVSSGAVPVSCGLEPWVGAAASASKAAAESSRNGFNIIVLL